MQSWTAFVIIIAFQALILFSLWGILYQLLKQDQNNRLMVWLEVTIVLLFIIDLVVLVMGLK